MTTYMTTVDAIELEQPTTAGFWWVLYSITHGATIA